MSEIVMPAKQPALTVDAIVLDDQERLLLIRRKYPPFSGQFALPGGFVEYGETVEAAAQRELMEETGLTALTQTLIGVYSCPDRDPRGHTVSIAFLITVAPNKPVASDDAATAEFITDWKSLPLAFDHNKIVADALKALKRK